MSPSDAASSPGGRGDSPGAGAQDLGDETNPAGVPVTPVTKSDSSKQARQSAWSDTARESRESSRETVHVDAAPTNAFAAAPAYASSGPGAGGYGGPGPVSAPTSPPPSGSSSRSGMARRARLKISHMGPLSVFRISLTFALCMFIVLLVAVAALWAVLDGSGVFKSIISTAATLTSDNKNSVGIKPWLSFGRVMLITVVLGAANVIAFTLLSTIGALLYNLCSDFVGGVEVTLVER